MCKLFAMTNISKVKLTQRFIHVVKEEVCKSDKDGFGYAVLDANGSISGERTIDYKRFHKGATKPCELDNLPVAVKSHDSFGSPGKAPKAFMAHGRFSTNEVSLDCTHPYVGKDFALIHNGVVQDAAKEPVECFTPNDTEILFRYWELGGMTKIAPNVTGYYAMIVLDADGQMHVIRDDMASLYITHCETVDSYMIATSEAILRNVAKAMKWRILPPRAFRELTHAIFNGNELVEWADIPPVKKAYQSVSRKELTSSLGYDPYDYNGADSRSYYSNPEREPEPKYREKRVEFMPDDGDPDAKWPNEWSYKEEISADGEYADSVDALLAKNMRRAG